MERNRQKLVGRDKGSLTEQQTEGTVTTTVQTRRKIGHKLAKQTLSPEQDRRRAFPSRESVPNTPPPPPEPSVTSHGMEYRALFGPGGVSPHPPAVPLPGVG